MTSKNLSGLYWIVKSTGMNGNPSQRVDEPHPSRPSGNRRTVRDVEPKKLFPFLTDLGDDLPNPSVTIAR